MVDAVGGKLSGEPSGCRCVKLVVKGVCDCLELAEEKGGVLFFLLGGRRIFGTSPE